MERKAITVSIVVPIYGTEAYLPACIESICNQTYQQLQIILVDDQSPDKCPDICDAYAQQDERITVIHQQNTGVSGARNTGMRHARGDYLMFVDSDDELLPNAVECLLQDAREYDVDIVSSKVRNVSTTGVVIEIQEDGNYLQYHEYEPLLMPLDEDPIAYCTHGKLFKTDFVTDIWFEEGKSNGEDGHFMFLCFVKKPRLLQHNIAVYQQNIREGSLSRSVFSDKKLSLLYFFEKKKEYITKYLPQYADKLYQSEVCVHIRLLDAMCSTKDKKYRDLTRRCVKTVRKLHTHYTPINQHHKHLVWIITYGLYPAYKTLIRMKYYR